MSGRDFAGTDRLRREKRSSNFDFFYLIVEREASLIEFVCVVDNGSGKRALSIFDII
jgi:hypothetical protein